MQKHCPEIITKIGEVRSDINSEIGDNIKAEVAKKIESDMIFPIVRFITVRFNSFKNRIYGF